MSSKTIQKGYPPTGRRSTAPPVTVCPPLPHRPRAVGGTGNTTKRGSPFCSPVRDRRRTGMGEYGERGACSRTRRDVLRPSFRTSGTRGRPVLGSLDGSGAIQNHSSVLRLRSHRSRSLGPTGSLRGTRGELRSNPPNSRIILIGLGRVLTLNASLARGGE